MTSAAAKGPAGSSRLTPAGRLSGARLSSSPGPTGCAAPAPAPLSSPTTVSAKAGASSSTPTASGSTYSVSWAWSGLACSRSPWPCSSRPPCATPSPTGVTLWVRSSWRFRRAWWPSWCTSPGTGTGTWPPSAWSSSCSPPPAPRTWRPGPPTVGGPGRQVRGAGGDEQEEDHADGGHVPVPVPGDVHHEGRHARLKRHEERTQRVLPVGEGVAHGGRDEQGHGGREQAKPDHTQLTKYVEPLA